jgi:UDP-N-acetylmuramate dehydrogenase
VSTKPSFHKSVEKAALLFKEKFGAHALLNEPLKTHVAYGVGGPADILVFPQTETDLLWVAERSKELQLPITVIGRGTNLLVRDEGIRGIVLSLEKAFKFIEVLPESPAGKTWVRVGGGTGKADLLNWAIEKGLTGLEFSSGVPGTIGGGIFMNAGTKYGCYGDILRELRLFDFKNGAETFSREQFHFGYREQTAVKDSLVVWATFELQTKPAELIRTEVNRIIQERAEKQPLDYPSCGSTFKNPEGFSAGRLIEKSGLKGLTIGGAQISEKHANFILNKNNAKAQDILDLIQVVKERVKEQSGVTLECEVIILGG